MISITLKEKREVARGTLLYSFDRPENFSFRAGQYVSMKVSGDFSDERGDFRVFSIASPPYRQDVLEFAMRRSASAFKKNLESLSIGNTVAITNATGMCVLPDPDAKKTVVFLIGGVGITPARSMILQAIYEDRSEKFVLLYSNRTPEDAPFFAEMSSWDREKKIKMTIVHTITDDTFSEWDGERGPIDAEKAKRYLGEDWSLCNFYVIGTAPFVEAIKTMLVSCNVPSERVHADNFGGR